MIETDLKGNDNMTATATKTKQKSFFEKHFIDPNDPGFTKEVRNRFLMSLLGATQELKYCWEEFKPLIPSAWFVELFGKEAFKNLSMNEFFDVVWDDLVSFCEASTFVGVPVSHKRLITRYFGKYSFPYIDWDYVATQQMGNRATLIEHGMEALQAMNKTESFKDFIHGVQVLKKFKLRVVYHGFCGSQRLLARLKKEGGHLDTFYAYPAGDGYIPTLDDFACVHAILCDYFRPRPVSLYFPPHFARPQ